MSLQRWNCTKVPARPGGATIWDLVQGVPGHSPKRRQRMKFLDRNFNPSQLETGPEADYLRLAIKQAIAPSLCATQGDRPPTRWGHALAWHTQTARGLHVVPSARRARQWEPHHVMVPVRALTSHYRGVWVPQRALTSPNQPGVPLEALTNPAHSPGQGGGSEWGGNRAPDDHTDTGHPQKRALMPL